MMLDNCRTKLLADRNKRQSLYCIRCGACLNHCPVYRKIGGHNYPWVYSGPIGAIITPQYHGIMQEPWLPYASSLCGACAEVCPVKIDIPQILLDLRAEAVKAKAREGENRLEHLGFRLWAWLMSHPRLYEMSSLVRTSITSEDSSGWTNQAPALLNHGPLKSWLSQRDLPPAPAKTFRRLWRERSAKGGG